MVVAKYLNMAYTVLHSLARMNRGGAETLIMNIFRHIDRSKYNFCFLLNEKECDYTKEIEELGGHIYTIPTRAAGLRTYCKALDSFLKEHKGEFDAVHMHTSSLSSLEFLYYAKKHGVKKRVIHSHNTVQAGLVHNILHWINKPVLKSLATDYLSCSQVASDWLYKYTGVWSKSIVVNNGVDLAQFAYEESYRNEVRKKHGLSLNDVVVGHVGRFDVVKNHTFLIDIFEAFLQIQPKAKLLCVGVGGELEVVKNKVKEIGLSNSVVFAGLQSEVYKYLSAFDYFVFPSLYEGLPVALVEAQASGVMTICSSKVSPEAKLSDYLNYFELEKSAMDWAQYIQNLEVLDRNRFVNQLEVSGYNINKTVDYLTEKIYI